MKGDGDLSFGCVHVGPGFGEGMNWLHAAAVPGLAGTAPGPSSLEDIQCFFKSQTVSTGRFTPPMNICLCVHFPGCQHGWRALLESKEGSCTQSPANTVKSGQRSPYQLQPSCSKTACSQWPWLLQMHENQAGCVLQVEEQRSLSSAPAEQAGGQPLCGAWFPLLQQGGGR